MNGAVITTSAILATYPLGAFGVLYLCNKRSLAQEKKDLRELAKSINAEKAGGINSLRFEGVFSGMPYKIKCKPACRIKGNTFRGKMFFYVPLPGMARQAKMHILRRDFLYLESAAPGVFFRKIYTGDPIIDERYIIKTNDIDKGGRALVDIGFKKLLGFCDLGFEVLLDNDVLYVGKEDPYFYADMVKRKNDIIATLVMLKEYYRDIGQM